MRIKYEGIFFDAAEVLAAAEAVSDRRLDYVVREPHVTFQYKPEAARTDLYGIPVEVELDGYACDGQNEAFRVRILTDNEKILAYAEEIFCPHITISIATGAQAVNSRFLAFEEMAAASAAGKASPVILHGIFGGVDMGDRLYTNSDCAPENAAAHGKTTENAAEAAPRVDPNAGATAYLKSSPKALIFGSLNIDQVYSVPHFVQAGETLSSASLQFFCGGKGLNQAVAFARCGVETFFAGGAGKNDSAMLLRCLEDAGVNTDLISMKDAPNGHAIIQTSPAGENCILLYGGANQLITAEDADRAIAGFSAGDYLILQNEINQLPYIMEKAHEAGMKIVLNPSPMDEKIGALPLEYADYLIVNEIEGAAMAQAAATNDELLETLVAAYPNARIMLTLGSEGAMYGYRDERYFQPVFPVKAVDTTAAGDTFTGYFFGSLMKGMSVKEAMRAAAMASSIAVSRPGASPSIPTADEVERALA